MAKDTTGRPATGMARYYMDIGWYRSSKFRGLGFDSLFLIEASVGYSLEHASDGRFPSDLEDLAAAFGVRHSAVRKAAPPLFDRGIWVDRGQGEAELVGYADHNPTKTEIVGMTEERSKLGRLANHKRWHEKRGKIDPSCPHCPGSPNGSRNGPGRDPRTDPETVPDPVPKSSHGMGWDGMSSSTGSPSRDPEPTANDPIDDDNAQLNDFAQAWIDLRCQDKNPAYKAKARSNAINELGDQALDLHRQKPDLTWTEIATKLAGNDSAATTDGEPDYAAMTAIHDQRMAEIAAEKAQRDTEQAERDANAVPNPTAAARAAIAATRTDT